MIDVHTHLGRSPTRGEPPVDENELLRRMNELGLERAVVLSLGASPEDAFFAFLRRQRLQRHQPRAGVGPSIPGGTPG